MTTAKALLIEPVKFRLPENSFAVALERAGLNEIEADNLFPVRLRAEPAKESVAPIWWKIVLECEPVKDNEAVKD